MTDPRRSPLWLLTRARLLLFFREWSAVFWAFGFPILLSVALGIAFRNRPPDPVDAAVQHGPGAEALHAALARSPAVRVRLLSAAEARQALRVGKVAVVVVPGGPSGQLAAPSLWTPRTYVLDPSRPESRLARVVVDDVLQRAAGRRDPTAVAERHVTEPGSRYIDFLLPGLLGMNIMSSGMWGIGYVIVETRTRKLLKRMLATPMNRGHFLFSFVLMRMLFMLVELPTLLLFGWLVFDVPVRGSIALLVGVATAGALAFAGVGLLVASRARNTQTVGGLINLVMMPMFIGSGVFFSASHFPDAAQPIIRALPLTALNDALRAVMNEGAGVMTVLPQLALLLGVSLVSFVVALKIFRWT